MVQTMNENEFFARVGLFGLNKVHVGFLDENNEIKTICGRPQSTGRGRQELYTAENETAATCQTCIFIMQQREGEPAQ